MANALRACGSAVLFLFFALFAAGQATEMYCKDQFLLQEAEARAGAARLGFRAAPHTAGYDLRYHRLEWSIDPAVYAISGRVTSYFVPLEANFQRIQFDLFAGLTVREVTRNGATLAFTQHADDRLEIYLNTTLPAGVLDSVSVRYDGVPRRTSFGSFSQGYHNNTPIIWTLSEPYGARDWWPCKQSLDDKIDSIDILVKTPQQYRAASNGLLIAETTSGTDKIYHWKHRYPIPAYLIAVAVTNYAVYSDFVPVEGGTPIEVLNYVYPERLASAKTETPATIGIMQLFNRLFGLYPFAEEKYGHAQFGFGGGMEHQTMSFMVNFSHSLIAHELAHQWFGDKITCGSWTDIWLNEGFATYLDGMTYEHGLGNKTWQTWLQQTMASARSNSSSSVFVDDTTSVNRIFSGALSYSKGAMLLHMLRWKLGDEVFFLGVRNYLNDPALAFGYARTADLQRHLEAVSGQDLNEFLRDWFYGKGYPNYRLLWNQNGSKVAIRIEQTTSNPAAVAFFEMPLPVQFSGAGMDTLLTFEHTFSGQQFEFSLPFTVQSVTIDPKLWILAGTKTVEKVLITNTRQAVPETLRLSPNPSGDRIFLHLPEGGQQLQYALFNQSGQLLRQGKATPEIDVASLPPGAYQLLLFDKKGARYQGRFVR